MTTRWPAMVAVAGTAGTGAAAAVLSFAALGDLAARSGVAVPALWPAGTGRYAWGLLIVGALVSVAGNVMHAALPDGALPVWLRATVAAVPPVALVAVAHLAVLLRHTTPTQAVVRDIATLGTDTTRDTDAPLRLGAAGQLSVSQGHTAHALVEPPVVAPVLAYRDTTATSDDDTATATGNDDTVRARALELLADGTSPRSVADQLSVPLSAKLL